MIAHDADSAESATWHITIDSLDLPEDAVMRGDEIAGVCDDIRTECTHVRERFSDECVRYDGADVQIGKLHESLSFQRRRKIADGYFAVYHVEPIRLAEACVKPGCGNSGDSACGGIQKLTTIQHGK